VAVTDLYKLHRFLDAQDGVFETALAELRAGLKRSHWMWFIFPQFAGLGSSAMARHFAISAMGEARAYLAHPILGPRLRQCVEALLLSEGHSAEQILGPIDAMKLRSSFTLFDKVEPDRLFADGLVHFFDGARDERTLALLNAQR
jgi:uncharacterized protein (DUF1810 family)